mmetsp:Transcript_22174/g.41554  ORF Transcript_22174/g.41554 Transcript_22174/m.41554 type:complete len:270 (-) Transcript_22174:13-822(-)
MSAKVPLRSSIERVSARIMWSFGLKMQSATKTTQTSSRAMGGGSSLFPQLRVSREIFPSLLPSRHEQATSALALRVRFLDVRARHSLRSVKTVSMPMAAQAMPATGDAPQPSSSTHRPSFWSSSPSFSRDRARYSARRTSAYHRVLPVPTDREPKRSNCRRLRLKGMPMSFRGCVRVYSIEVNAWIRLVLLKRGCTINARHVTSFLSFFVLSFGLIGSLTQSLFSSSSLLLMPAWAPEPGTRIRTRRAVDRNGAVGSEILKRGRRACSS